MAGIEGSLNYLIPPIAEALEREVRIAGPSRGLIGAHVGAVVMRLRPTYKLDFSVKNLREFIEQFVPTLHIIGNQGGDVVYGLAEWPKLSDRVPESDMSFWRVWVSPTAHLSLAIGRETNQVRQVAQGQQDKTEFELRPASPEVHRRIAQNFLKSCADDFSADVQERLGHILASSKSAWWLEWMEAIRTFGRDLNTRWLEFRRAELQRELQQALEQNGVVPETAAKVAEGIAETRFRPRFRADEGAPPARIPPSPKDRRELIQLVQRVVSQMRDEELHGLLLPLGLVLDALSQKGNS